ncbi:hypothetical protein FRB98_006319 [Tulasnella sp. 332]|nr:hypothetical protein FRB98_006319 [Tulasnella sp. 332]
MQDHWTRYSQSHLPDARYAHSNYPLTAGHHASPAVVYVEPPPCRTHILVCIKSTLGAVTYNHAADNDIRLWLRATEVTLRNPRNRFYLVTDCVNVMIPASARALVRIITPTRSNIEQTIRFAVTTLGAMDECTVWFSCTAQEDVQAIRLANPLETITGPQLYSWLTENTLPSALIRVGLDCCYSGRFLGNPQITRLRDLENVLSPRLSDTVNGEWEQFPQVSMSYHDPHAVFQNWF